MDERKPYGELTDREMAEAVVFHVRVYASSDGKKAAAFLRTFPKNIRDEVHEIWREDLHRDVVRERERARTDPNYTDEGLSHCYEACCVLC